MGFLPSPSSFVICYFFIHHYHILCVLIQVSIDLPLSCFFLCYVQYSSIHLWALLANIYLIPEVLFFSSWFNWYRSTVYPEDPLEFLSLQWKCMLQLYRRLGIEEPISSNEYLSSRLCFSSEVDPLCGNTINSWY